MSRKMYRILFFAVIADVVMHVVVGSSEGLYIMRPEVGQLNRVQWQTGNITAVGTPLEHFGWIVPSCAPAAVDTTGKWYYTLVHNNKNEFTGEADGSTDTGVVSKSELYLIDVWMSDGTIRGGTGFAIPAAFPTTIEASSFSLIALGGWDVYVIAVVEKNLVIYSMSRLDPTKTSSAKTLDADLSTLGIGFSAKYPTATLDPYNNILWYKLEKGVVGFNMTDTTITRQPKYIVTIANRGLEIGGMAFDSRTSLVFGAALDSTSTVVGSTRNDPRLDGKNKVARLVWFTSGGSRREVSVQVANAIIPVPDRDGSAILLASDQRQVVVLSHNFTTWTTISLTGVIVSQAEASCARTAEKCAVSSMAYEPFVF